MSKLADKIRKTLRPSPQPLGFAPAAARAPQPTLLCVVALASGDAGKAVEAFEKGADAVIVDGGLKKTGESGGPVGVVLANAGREDVARLREEGADFVVLRGMTTAAEALLEENVGYVLEAPEDAEDTKLRLIGDLGLDALVVSRPPAALTLEDLLALRRIAALTRLPLLAPVAGDESASRLQALRDSGVCGVIVDGSALGRLKALRETIMGLPARGRRRDEHGDGVIPAGVAVAGRSAGDEDGEDDDDD